MIEIRVGDRWQYGNGRTSIGRACRVISVLGNEVVIKFIGQRGQLLHDMGKFREQYTLVGRCDNDE